MRKKIIVGLGVVALMLFLGDSALAQEASVKRAGIGLRVSYYEVDDIHPGALWLEPETAALFEGNFTFFFNRLVSLELAGGYFETDTDFTLLGFAGHFGKFEQIPILGTMRIHLWHPDVGRPSNFYFGVGVGYYINDNKVSSAVTGVLPALNIDMDDSLGAHINGGFEINLLDNVALNVDAKYIFTNEADVTLSEPTLGTSTTTVDLKGWIVGVGLKYYF